MRQNLSTKQQKVLDFISEYLNRAGFPPTVREISGRLGLSGPNSAKKILDILERKGCIKRQPGCSRAIEIIGRAAAPLRSLPVAGTIRAGQPSLALEDIERYLSVDPSLARGENLFFLRVKGDSMTQAHIIDGDFALIRSQPAVASGEIAAVLIGDEATLKIVYRDKNSLRLQPANPAFEPIIIARDQSDRVRIIGKVVAVVRTMEQQ